MLQTMLATMLSYPHIDPVAASVGPFVIRWYALAYISGLILGWYYIVRLARLKSPHAPKGVVVSRTDIDDFILWATLGIILGGRIGYVLFYNFDLYSSDPMAIFKVWQGGMSFHGGLLGVTLAILLFTRRRKIPLLAFADLIACAAPIGLFFGRLANFINGELWGRASDVPWAMIFPDGGPLPRHPSQLYEAGMEGFLLFSLLWFLAFKTSARARPGLLTGVFLTGYASARMFGEQFREPDEQLGFLFGHVTMGQLLSLPMLLVGLALIAWPLMKKAKKPA